MGAGETEHERGNLMLKRSPDMVARKVGEEYLLVPVGGGGADLGAVYVLNNVAARVWELLEEGNTEGEIVAQLGEEFEAPADRIGQDVAEFVGEMRQIGAVVEA
jgi:hypothetical protein